MLWCVQNQKKMGIGVIARDFRGEVLFCLSASKSFSSHPLVAEFWALWRALELCSELSMEQLIFEGDAQSLIQAINTGENCEAWYDNLVEDPKQIIKNRIYWSVNFVHREANNITHVLAKFGLSLLEETLWMEDFPTIIE